MAEISGEDREREDSALLARGHHDDVVRLVGDAEAGLVPSDQCQDVCPRLLRVHGLAERICDIAAGDDHDEATQFLCEDARARESGVRRRLAEGSCGGSRAVPAGPGRAVTAGRQTRRRRPRSTRACTPGARTSRLLRTDPP